jgi:hypothetical protein
VKTVFDAKTGELLGAHMVGAEVTELIQGYVVGRTLETTEAELMNTVFPHPTLSRNDARSRARRLRTCPPHLMRSLNRFWVAVPFSPRFTARPVDCSRWTARGLKNLLVEGGFEADRVQSHQWGNRRRRRGIWKPLAAGVRMTTTT